ncbi:MAG: glycine dehydrogenase [Myxococcota bacterium]|jgi:glycine dehydrogenase
MPIPEVDAFVSRHIGPSGAEVRAMLETLQVDSLDALVNECVPDAIRMEGSLDLPPAATERAALAQLQSYADENEVWRSYIGAGYHGTVTPPVLLRNVLENPGWYTAYTPYQPEVSQGRLEALLVYQTVVQELCALEIANASLLDEATAAAEAMTMAFRLTRGKNHTFYVAEDVHPQTLAVVQTRAEPLGISVVVGHATEGPLPEDLFGVLLQYPATDGVVHDLRARIAATRAAGALSILATDLLALCLLTPPGELGADIAVGSSQRFGVPMGYGGPHAAFIACSADHKRQLPGRLIGVSVDHHGNPALRMALQTREQHIRRKKATSNICTAQVLLAVVAGLYAVWHGPEGLKGIAGRVHGLARALRTGLANAGYDTGTASHFGTVRVAVGDRRDTILAAAGARRINLRVLDAHTLAVSLDETTGVDDLADLLAVFGVADTADSLVEGTEAAVDGTHARSSSFLSEAVFHQHRSETQMLRYLHQLEARDLSLTTSMIPLGSCTMKLNATTEMIPVTWSGFGGLHPFAPVEQARGYGRLFSDLERWLAEITGFDAMSLQPNAGSQGEYAGLLTIRRYHQAAGDHGRDVCLIPVSAHGTNPASAVMAGMQVVVVACDDSGNIDVADLRAQAERHAGRVGALMVTYPSTHGVFEESIREICDIVHAAGGLVYMDGANMNAMVGLCRPADLGADVCHLNLHKTFCIPHGGGGPGMGPIGVTATLRPYLPGHPVIGLEANGHELPEGPVSAAPWGSPSILPITWAYIRMLGEPGLRRASCIAILNANYIAERLRGHYDVLYTGTQGRVAHECILDTRPFKASGVLVDDIAKRLMDFGFHAPTMSWPVAGTLMVEPTESESKAELDRFIDAMIAIRNEIRAVEAGNHAIEDSALRHAPHTAADVLRGAWDRPYSREEGAFPAPWTRQHKYWPTVGRVDNAFGDRNLICSCDAWPNTAS